ALMLLADRLAVCRLDPEADLPSPACRDGFWSVTRTAEEISVVLPESAAQPEWRIEAGWRAFQVAGPLAFGLTGVVASLTLPLAEAGVPVFVLSTFDTDYLLVKELDLERAREALAGAGHALRE
ncbi:MAG TPA: ACT domain-containing protein, partial [Thermoanaerobaculia bacterium]|nr:ACT domain-containing protein [Thermoanaerobaculia bacterium]